MARQILRLCVSTLVASTLMSTMAVAMEDGITLRVLPGELTLSGSESAHRVLVEQFRGTDAAGPAAPETTLVADDPEVVRIDGYTLVPLKNGTTRVRVEGVSSDVSAATVVVQDMG
ncbi:MAG: hypothetical protein ACK56I_31685, partial [bacterium]